MCRVLEVSTSGYYAWRVRNPSVHTVRDVALTERVRAIHTRSRGTYGVPRIHAELADDGVHVGRKRVGRLMRKAGPQGVTRRKRALTTVRRSEDRPAPDLVQREFSASGPNQLWVADITYIRLKRECGYLAVLLDAYSRKVVGWALDRTLAARLPIAALTHALAERHLPPGLVHHSDRGVQYASETYVTLLRTHHIIPSMSRPANPYDNASCESFMKTLKREEIYANTYRDLDHLRANIAAFIERYYNRDRLHSALGYHSPEEFEQAASSAPPATGATMRFFRPRAHAHAASSARDQAEATEGV